MIPEKFKDTLQHYKEYEYTVLGIENEVFLTEASNPNPLKRKSDWHSELSDFFEKEYEKYSNNKVFFVGCSIGLYRELYSKRLKIYLEENTGALEVDFIIRDFNTLNEDEIFEFAPEHLKEKIIVSYRRQKDLLKEKAISLGFEVFKVDEEISKNRYRYKKKESETKTESLLDLSDSSLTEKIIYLELLGVLKFIRENSKFGISNNSLASLVSAITGGKPETIQSYINPIGNPSVGQKNNPMNKEEGVEAIKSKLIDLGFSIK
ncbi:MAG TPA: hypothetical protein EYN07_02380 [Flavobacteriaceae bacterium]|nr:hypothetical protein [Flavobacteriaceae bacterium]HIN98066.1 hypothetical protein [Flavobacteriaceae bacterium]